MPIFSLSGKYGIGTLGKEAYKFIDFLERAGQTYWQILPLSPTSVGDSPYQSFSAYAGNPYFIDFKLLENDGYLKESEYSEIEWGNKEKINYSLLYNKRFDVLRKAYNRFIKNPTDDYFEFLSESNHWLNDYALFRAIKNQNNGNSFDKWDDKLKFRDPKTISATENLLKNDIDFFKVIEYFFWVQWRNLKSYANSKNIKIIGDIPIYVSYDSADLWCEPKQFHLDENLIPIDVAGCPPDVFSTKGQLWGNPIYNWEYMKQSNNPYEWWQKRIAHTLRLYDVIRIDHFRGFESYYAVPYGSIDAVNGEWRKGPGISFFENLKEKFGDLPIIAEDLGFFTDDVKEMLTKSGFPGMKVLQFGFDGSIDSAHLPHNCIKNSVIYTGTHDNDTLIGWINTLDIKQFAYLKDYLNQSSDEKLYWSIICSAFASVSDTVIIPMQDYLGLDSTGRINTPSTLGENWKWRISDDALNDNLSEKIRKITKIYCR